MKSLTVALLFLLSIPGLAAPKPASFDFIEIHNDPNATVRPRGINNAGDISGNYYSNQHQGGFILKANKELINLTVPNALLTSAAGIDDEGRVVGTFLDYECPGPCEYQTKSFIYQNGQYTILTFPGAYATQAVDIDEGRIVGWFNDATLRQHGFLYDNGQWTQLDYPGDSSTFANGISGNRIVGTAQSIDQQHGYIYLIAEKTWQEIRFPRPGDRTALAAVSANAIVGYVLATACGFEPFILTRDRFSVLDLPSTQIYGINDAGYVVGDFGLERGFVAQARSFILRK